jgi:uncharacterized membrane protein (UPF0127 family)
MPELPEGKSVLIGEKEFLFSFAETALELITGLKGVTRLEPYNGMLFDFGHESYLIMTPKGLIFPVEVAFISEEGRIKEIKCLDPANGFIRSSSVRARYALEVPVGFFETHNIQIGDSISL